MDNSNFEFPQTLQLERVVVVEEPEFIAQSGQRSRGYVPTVEIWNNLTRVNIAFPATPLSAVGKAQFFNIRVPGGEIFPRLGVTGVNHDLVTFHTAVFGPVPQGATNLEVLYAVADIPVENLDDLVHEVIATVSL